MRPGFWVPYNLLSLTNEPSVRESMPTIPRFSFQELPYVRAK